MAVVLVDLAAARVPNNPAAGVAWAGQCPRDAKMCADSAIVG